MSAFLEAHTYVGLKYGLKYYDTIFNFDIDLYNYVENTSYQLQRAVRNNQMKSLGKYIRFLACNCNSEFGRSWEILFPGSNFVIPPLFNLSAPRRTNCTAYKM